jgi:hypothetical protein
MMHLRLSKLWPLSPRPVRNAPSINYQNLRKRLLMMCEHAAKRRGSLLCKVHSRISTGLYSISEVTTFALRWTQSLRRECQMPVQTPSQAFQVPLIHLQRLVRTM